MRVLFITSNRGKFEEAKKYLEPLGVELIQKKFEYPEIQASKLEDVVKFGIEWLKDEIDMPFFIDDSGLFIEAFGGFPGVYSAYIFKTLGNEGILKLMDGIENRRAYFESVIGYYNGKLHIFKGIVHGSIGHEKRGNRGFGFDPIFIPEGFSKTFAEMTTEEKNNISHRGRALSEFSKWLKENLGSE
ncbi:deoxyribonucleotide triphosphate pyrophosphatase [Palaeococcus pacificus DY20341]|uniref:dITP/XTP pyrophosphatase n=1 Tax=Palaeococcus pacificus DY20341 TaxID=1343739 RepID=A0A075LWH7_9EURY|nr:XTP/dITP diphosphatase [Palaeococcus pacificus]AIF70402.1 deoxyribonucleotide triphosphate pyrophosphatase [Palaeococcus pacificus DY20341]